MKQVRSTVIEASAGSGKTWQLANRFLALMALGVAPERMIALTFTRKAAGEFTERILQRLAAAAADELRARQLADQLQEVLLGDEEKRIPALLCGEDRSLPAMDRRHFSLMLEALVRVLDRLSLGTLDSFFARMVRTMVLELGMGGFDFLEETELENQRLSVLAAIFSPRVTGAVQQEEFFQAFKLATFGSSETRLTKMLDAFVREHHDRFLESADMDVWGSEEFIWPDGCRWEPWKERMEAIGQLRRHFEQFKWNHGNQPRKWEEVLALLEGYEGGGRPLDRKLGNFLEEKIAPNLAALESGGAILKINKDLEYPPPISGLIAGLFGSLMEEMLRSVIKRTRGLGQVLAFYEERYQDLVRMRGKLGFSDLTTLLAGYGGSSPLDKEGALQELVYRLDGFFDHWMLDEFQDTSRSQWRVIGSMVDEVVQDAEGGRTLFVVGDGKQSIYGWRGGDSRLFGELRDRYRGGIDIWPMDESRRSVAEVLALVNRVCDLQNLHLAKPFPAEMMERWNFREHKSAVAGRGQAVVYELAAKDGKLEEGEGKSQYQFIVGLLQRQRPLERGCSTAILVRSNKEAEAVAEALRRNGIPVALESDVAAAQDGPAGAALLDLLSWLRCPLDGFALGHFSMTPMVDALAVYGSDPADIWHGMHQAIACKGLARVIEGIIGRLCDAGVLAAFSRERLDRVLEAVVVFESRGGGGIEEWVRMLEGLKVREAGTVNEVQVMTLHKAKGLGFDFVIVTGLGGRNFDDGKGLSVLETREGPDHDLRHLLINPGKSLAANFDVLRSSFNDWEADQCYEGCCNVYVALTRARSAAHVILGARPKNSTPKWNAEDWIRMACGDKDEELVEEGGVVVRRLFSSGSEDWLPDIKDRELRDQKEAIQLPGALVRRRASRRASGLSGGGQTGRGTWGAREQAKEHGSLVHALFEGIEWWPDKEVSLPSTPAGLEVRKFLDSSGGMELFARPLGNVQLLREVPVEYVSGGEWLSGVVDRLVLNRDESGAVVSGEIIDFKTDRIGEADLDAVASHHFQQLDYYRRALGKAFGLDVKLFHPKLVFTALGRVVSLSSKSV